MDKVWNFITINQKASATKESIIKDDVFSHFLEMIVDRVKLSYTSISTAIFKSDVNSFYAILFNIYDNVPLFSNWFCM